MLQRIVGEPEFLLAPATMDALYGQALIWIGTFFSPLLPVIGVCVTVTMFWVKYHSMMLALSPPRTYYRVSSYDTFTLLFMLITLFLCVGPVGYALLRLTPSQACGPFRGAHDIWSILGTTLASFPPWLESAVRFMGAPAFVLPLIILLVCSVYFFRVKDKVEEEFVRDLHLALMKQLQDKRTLIQALQIDLNMAAATNTHINTPHTHRGVVHHAK
jgi:hypothetical protein